MQSLNSKQDAMPCDFPYNIKNPRYTGIGSSEMYIPVPCGTCPPCCKRRADGWIFRLLQHDKVSQWAFFVTLTYATEHVPISPRGFLTLQKKDYQLFMKRLRKAHPKETRIQYYAVGEYGSTNFRPHFHAIIFNADRERINDAWGLGQVVIGSVGGASVAYVTKYMSKGKLIPQHSNDDRIPEFSLMSKKLGSNYLTPEMLAYHKADINRNFATLEGGQKIALPRYLRDKIYNDEEKELQGKNIAKLSKAAEETRIREFTERTGNPDDYVRAKHEAKKASIINFRNTAKNNRKL